ncbi:site-specific integrase [Chromobacterium haemolyticum]|uniref:Site-specific integrase n=1 Tax=Chromobacterium fluminis TaxID=3044269 RepID=A0ABX0LGL7_9NEIS|nr:site-specific integrase [Chromobacterium haemolyticum]NHR08368.1 site-specific integrase [Chromobacterium haemolyticum]
MATIIPVNGKWRATVRKKVDGKLILNKSRTFASKKLAEDWAKRLEVDVQDDAGLLRFKERDSLRGVLVSDLIERYFQYVEPVKPLGATKRNVLETLRDSKLGKRPAGELSAQDVLEYCRERQQLYGNGPATLTQYVGYLRQVLELARTAWGVMVSTVAVDDAKPMLRHLGLVGQGGSRDRRLVGDEYQRLLAWFQVYDESRAKAIKMAPVFRFAVAIAMRREEICRIRRADVDHEARTVIVRDRKDPRNKAGNDQVIPLLGESWAIVLEQLESHSDDLIFPYDPITVSAVFQRGAEALGLGDLRFHDLRHEGASLLFEAGYSIEEVALVTGHKNWNMLRRYTQLRPASLHHKPAAANLAGADVMPKQESRKASTVKRKLWVVKTPDGYLHPLEDGMGYVEAESDAWGWPTAAEAQDALEEEGGAGELLRVLMPVS